MGQRQNILRREDVYPDPTVQGVNDVIRFAFETPAAIGNRVEAAFSDAAEPGVGGKLRALANPDPVLDRQRGMDIEAKAPEFFQGVREDMRKASAFTAEADRRGVGMDDPHRQEAHNLGMSAHGRLMGFLPKMIANGQDPQDLAPLITESARLAGYTLNPTAPGGMTDAYRLGEAKPEQAATSERAAQAFPQLQQEQDIKNRQGEQDIKQKGEIFPFEKGYKANLARESGLRGDQMQSNMADDDEVRRDERDKRHHEAKLREYERKYGLKADLAEKKARTDAYGRQNQNNGDPIFGDAANAEAKRYAGEQGGSQPLSPDDLGEEAHSLLENAAASDLFPQDLEMRLADPNARVTEEEVEAAVLPRVKDPRIAKAVWELIKAGDTFKRHKVRFTVTPAPARQ